MQHHDDRTQLGDAPVASVEEIRSHFPSLTTTHLGRPIAFFDGPGGTQLPQPVIDAVHRHLSGPVANRSMAYQSSVDVTDAIGQAREAIADWVGGGATEVVFGANMTTLNFHLARSLSRDWRAGETVVVTDQDHFANVDPWREAAKDVGVHVNTVGVTTDHGTLQAEDIGSALYGGKTRLFAFSAASNVTGAANDVRLLSDQTHDACAISVVDAVHHAAHCVPDAKAWNCDFLLCSTYKFFGPHVGVLWGRHELIEQLNAPRLSCGDARAPGRLETGTLSHEGIIGAAAAVEFLASLARHGGSRRARLLTVSAALHQRSCGLFAELFSGLRSLPGVHLYGPPPSEHRMPTLAFSIDGWVSRDAARRLGESGLYLSHGHLYAPRLVEALGGGVDGFVRAGICAYTTSEDVDRLVSAVRALAHRSHRDPH